MLSSLFPYALLALALVGCSGDGKEETGGPEDSCGADCVIDEDGDGYSSAEGDCDETDAAVNPDAAELCDAIDNDCNGVVDLDATDAPTWYGDSDADGYGSDNVVIQACDAPSGFAAESGDCDDGDGSVYPGADETCSDTEDRNCDGSVGYADADADGTPACEDCDDADGSAFPGAEELCDGADDDCDGSVDEDATDAQTWYTDADKDGYGLDGTGIVACEQPEGTAAAAGDCDDGSDTTYPGAEEACDEAVDANCDGSVGYADADADGTAACDDCDDSNASAFPGAAETCNGVDDNCDGAADEAGAVGEGTWYADADGDGFGDATITMAACDAPAGYVADATDCDDTNGAVNPGVAEVCDDAGVDEDCDGGVDDADVDGATSLGTWYADTDEDGYGDVSVTVTACDAPAGFVAIDADCDDTDAAVNPDATEVCDGEVDEDCDGDVDDDDASVDPASLSEWYIDYDGDTYGADGTFTVSACEGPAGYVASADDCDDLDPNVNAGGSEVCDELDTDEDCDGVIDDDDASVTGRTVRYYDADSDGYGQGASRLTACDFPADYVENADDCNDLDANVSPAGTEVCDAADTDEDCDGVAEDADASVSGTSTFYFDADSDGYGTASITLAGCDLSSVWSANPDDCDDGDDTVRPSATEIVGDERDSDCDGGEICYLDADADGYLAVGGSTVVSADDDCTDASEATSSAPTTDCDDGDATISPMGVESCNSVDDDCDGTVDDGVGSTWYQDVDGDGYGSSITSSACDLPTGYSATTGDCDDGEALAYPGATEVCADGLDNDCDADVADCSFDGTYAAATHDFRLTGTTSSDYMGRSLDIGDFDGDGNADLVGGMPNYDSPSSTTGAAAIWYGPVTASGTASSASAMLTGSASTQYTGYYTAFGDHDGDGADDLLIGAYGASSYAGTVYLLYGGTRLSGTATAASTSGVATFTGGASSDYLGYHLASGGDLDGDGTDELLLGAYLQDGAASSAGAAYLFYGAAARHAGAASATTADATIRGVASSDYLGYATSFIDDMDGDGRDELLVGAYGDDTVGSSAGAAYLFMGDTVQLAGTISATAADYTFRGSAASDYAGYGVYRIGDVDGDGYGDAAVNGYGYDNGSTTSVGALWIYEGAVGGISATATATLYGAGSSDYFGEEAYSPGDLDGDGADDLVAGAYSVDTAYSSAGAAYLFYGPLSGSISASTADAIFLGGATGDGYFGRRLPKNGGDLTGDGLNDVAAGAYWDDSYAYDAGSIYIWAGLGGD